MPGVARATTGGVGYNGELHECMGQWQNLGNGYRIYSPALRRFHSPDELSPFQQGGTNAYAYGRGDPISYKDPNGQWAVPVVTALTAAGALAVGVGAVAAKVSGNVKSSEILGLVAGVLASVAGAVVINGILTHYRGLKQGQMRVYKRADRDVVLVHGEPNMTVFGKADLDGTQLASVVKSKGVGNKPIELISCYGADGPASQGRVLASATGQAVTTYKGPVRYSGLLKRVVWGSRVKFVPETGMDKAVTALRNQVLNRKARRAEARGLAGRTPI